MQTYDPFTRGPWSVGVRTVVLVDRGRDRRFPVELWYPAHCDADAVFDRFPDGLGRGERVQQAAREAPACAGEWPLVLFSHSSGNDRRQSTFLCTHLASHGHVVAALDHSERVAPELARRPNESEGEQQARWRALIDARVPDLLLLHERVLAEPWPRGTELDPTRLGLVGHSFGGWSVLAAVEHLPSAGAVVALAPAGARERRPGMLPVELEFAWERDVPTLYLVAGEDRSLPLEGMRELYLRTPAHKRLVILERADHMHFMDEAEALHELVRTMPAGEAFASVQRDMLPIRELSSGAEAETVVRGLALAHLQVSLADSTAARRFLETDLGATLVARGLHVRVESD